jgi:SAM-dependent methyltransferase
VRAQQVAVAAIVGYFVVASLAASWWVYDLSELHRWGWVEPLLPECRDSWLVIHAGFDAAGPGLAAMLGGKVAVIDVATALRHISPSLRRARRRAPANATTVGVVGTAGRLLPIADRSVDGVVLAFAAHEVRDVAQRELLFDELHRVLKPGGRVVLVEHVRDAANIAVFGPAAWHFLPRREWERLADRAAFTPGTEVSQTPFVRAWSLCPR